MAHGFMERAMTSGLIKKGRMDVFGRGINLTLSRDFKHSNQYGVGCGSKMTV
jgi:hypothetical protein